MSNYRTAATAFADKQMLGFISIGRKNYTVYATHQENRYANPFDKTKLQKIARTPNLLEAMKILHDFMMENYSLPFSMRIKVDIWWGGFQCTLYVQEFDANGKLIDGYCSKYGFKHYNGYLSESDLYYSLVRS